MFNNVLNRNDLRHLVRRLRREGVRKATGYFLSGRDDRVAEFWATVEYEPIHSWDVPAVLRRGNGLITGDANALLTLPSRVVPAGMAERPRQDPRPARRPASRLPQGSIGGSRVRPDRASSFGSGSRSSRRGRTARQSSTQCSSPSSPNFAGDDPLARKALDLVFAAENLLLEAGELETMRTLSRPCEPS